MSSCLCSPLRVCTARSPPPADCGRDEDPFASADIARAAPAGPESEGCSERLGEPLIPKMQRAEETCMGPCTLLYRRSLWGGCDLPSGKSCPTTPRVLPSHTAVAAGPGAAQPPSTARKHALKRRWPTGWREGHRTQSYTHYGRHRHPTPHSPHTSHQRRGSTVHGPSTARSHGRTSSLLRGSYRSGVGARTPTRLHRDQTTYVSVMFELDIACAAACGCAAGCAVCYPNQDFTRLDQLNGGGGGA